MADNLSNNKRIAKNTMYLYVRMLFVLGITLYTSRVILKTLGIDDFGIYNVVAGFVSMFAFLNHSLSICIQRYYNYSLGEEGELGLKKVFGTSLVIQSLLAFVVVILVESVGIWFLENKLIIPDDRLYAAHFLFQMTVISMLCVILQVPYMASIMAHEKMDYYALVGIIDISLKLIIVIVLYFVSIDKLIVYGILLAVVSLVDFLFYYVYAKQKFEGLQGSFAFNKLKIKEMISFAGWSILGSFALVIRNQGLNVILNIFFGPTVNAARGLSFQIKSALVNVISNIASAARPQMIESYAKGNVERSTSLLCTLSKICFILMYMMALPLCVEVDYVLKLWLGSNIPEYTAIFTILIMIVSLIDCFNGYTTTIIYATGKIAFYNVTTSCVGMCVLPLSYIFLKCGYGPIWVYISSIIISISIMIVSIYCQKRTVGIKVKDYCNRTIIPSLMLFVCTFWAPFIIVKNVEPSIFRLLGSIVLSVLIISIVSYLTFSKKERLAIRNIILKILKKL